jgi:glycosyltransferase involved in cell wall biosynthesis
MAIVSVCIPVFNRCDMVMGAVNSALAQDIDGLEVIISDNCSDDGTWEQLSSISDARVHTHRNEQNLGMVENFTRACNLASGEFLLLLCSDDKLEPGFLKHAVDLMRARPSAVLLSSVGRFVATDGQLLWFNCRRIPPGVYDGTSVRRAFFEYTGRYRASIFNYPAGILMRRSVYRQASPFRAEVGNPTDADMWIRCLQYGDFLVTDYVACEITRHSDQRGMVGYKDGRYFRELLIMEAKHLTAPEDAIVRRRFRRRLGGIAFSWAFGPLLKGNRGPWCIARELGWNGAGMALAFVERLVYRGLAKLGFVTVSGLVERR